MKHKKRAFYAIKYLPVAMGVIMVADSALYLLNRHSDIMEVMAGTGLMSTLLIFAASTAYGFCWIHKLFSLYVLQSSVATCFFFQYMRPQSVFCHNLLFFAEGITLIILLMIKIKMFHKDALKAYE